MSLYGADLNLFLYKKGLAHSKTPFSDKEDLSKFKTVYELLALADGSKGVTQTKRKDAYYHFIYILFMMGFYQ